MGPARDRSDPKLALPLTLPNPHTTARQGRDTYSKLLPVAGPAQPPPARAPGESSAANAQRTAHATRPLARRPRSSHVQERVPERLPVHPLLDRQQAAADMGQDRCVPAHTTCTPAASSADVHPLCSSCRSLSHASRRQHPSPAVRNGHIKRLTDADIQSSVLEIMGSNVSTTYITTPADLAQTLGIKVCDVCGMSLMCVSGGMLPAIKSERRPDSS